MAVAFVLSTAVAAISQEVRRRVADRDGVLNPVGYELHHCFFHSEVDNGIPKEELEQEWNYQSVKKGVHNCIHHASTDEMVAMGHKAEIHYKELALNRYFGQYKDKLNEILYRKRIHYGIFS